MGVWGTGLYQDDVTCDVKEEYLNRLKIGMSDEEATTDLIENNEDYLDDEEGLFYLALADTQWRYGRLSIDIKEKALNYIQSGIDLERWEDDQKLIQKRKIVLNDLEKKLSSPMPEKKNVSKIKFERAKWNQGDIISIKITTEELKDSAWYDKEVILEIIGVTRLNIGSLPVDKYYHEIDVAKVCGIKDNLLTDKELKQPEIILSLNNREIKKLNIKTIANKDMKTDLNIIDRVRKEWVHGGNIEYVLIRLLNDLYK